MDAATAIAGDQLRTIIERIEHLEEEIKELTEAKKEIYLEAKGNGFDVKIVREIIRLRKQDAEERDERETLIDLYWKAIQEGSAAGGKKSPTRTSAKVEARSGAPPTAAEPIHSDTLQ
jgi:uncharacterized protein (UPF0335 family)